MKLLQELLTINAQIAVRDRFNATLLEAVNKNLLAAVAAFKAAKPEKGDELRGVDTDVLAKLITGIKVITKPEYRSALTKDDVGINPNNVRDLLAMLDEVPNAPKDKLSGTTAKFFTAVCSLSKSLLEKSKTLVKNCSSTDPEERTEALKELTQFASKVDQLVTRMRATTSGKPA